MRLSDEVLSVECDDLDLRHGPTRLLAACLYWRRRALAAERQREVIVNNEPNEQEESAQSIPLGAPAELPPFDDPRVQLVYGLLCDTDSHPPPEQHWEGWLARRIVAALKAAPQEPAEPVAHYGARSGGKAVKFPSPNLQQRGIEYAEKAGYRTDEANFHRVFYAYCAGFTDGQTQSVADAQDAWLEKLFVRKWNGVIDSGSRFNWEMRGDWRHYIKNMEGETFSEAVRAAMALGITKRDPKGA
jgi:hypothetical protein